METKKELILQSAYNVLVDEGIEGFSLSKVGKKANIPTSLIFHYFENKNALLLELVEFILYTNDSRVLEYMKVKGKITKEAFVKYIDRLFFIDFEEKKLIQAYYACFYLSMRNEDIKIKFKNSISFARNNYKEIFRMFAQKDIIQEKNIELAVDYVLSAVAGIAKIADVEYGEQSINKELIALHKNNLFQLLEFNK